MRVRGRLMWPALQAHEGQLLCMVLPGKGVWVMLQTNIFHNPSLTRKSFNEAKYWTSEASATSFLRR